MWPRWVRIVTGVLVGQFSFSILVFVALVGGFLLLPCNSGGFLCTDGRDPYLYEWIRFFLILIGIASLPGWLAYWLAGLRPPWKALLASVATNVGCIVFTVFFDRVAIDTDLYIALLNSIWLLGPGVAAFYVGRAADARNVGPHPPSEGTVTQL
jgi:hypothetical protein